MERGVALATRIVGFHPVKWRLGYSTDSIDGLRLLPHTVLVQSKANRTAGNVRFKGDLGIDHFIEELWFALR